MMDTDIESKYIFTAQAYRTLCLLATIVLVSWCIYEYSMDRDVTEIKLQQYHETSDDIYPSITICSTVVFLKEKYTKHIKSKSCRWSEMRVRCLIDVF